MVKSDAERKDVDEKIKQFSEEFHQHGMECGHKIANIAAILHPDAVLIVPLYRSCIVVKQNDQEKKDGSCEIHGYADPHWLGGDINIASLESEDFHFYYKVQGTREGPALIKMKSLPLVFNSNAIMEEHAELSPTQIKEILDKEKSRKV